MRLILYIVHFVQGVGTQLPTFFFDELFRHLELLALARGLEVGLAVGGLLRIVFSAAHGAHLATGRVLLIDVEAVPRLFEVLRLRDAVRAAGRVPVLLAGDQLLVQEGAPLLLGGQVVLLQLIVVLHGGLVGIVLALRLLE